MNFNHILILILILKPGSAWRPLSEYNKGPNGDGKINKDSVEVPRDIEAGKKETE